MIAILQDVTWTVVVAFLVVFAAICFLAVLWSRREWKSRKIRIGFFLEREYDGEPKDDEAPTKTDWPLRK